MRYGQVLNARPTYRKRLLDALVTGGPLPTRRDWITDGPSEGAPHTTLLPLLEARDFSRPDELMRLQAEKFGPVNDELFWSVIAYVGHRGTRLAPPLAALVHKSHSHPTHVPLEETFTQWQTLHKTYFADAVAFIKTIVPVGITTHSNADLVRLFTRTLAHAGLADAGWTAVREPLANFVTVDKPGKRLLIGPDEVRMSRLRLIGLLLHEIYIHALWAQHYHMKGTSNREEGVGTLVEQLTIRRYHPLRMYRFLAICFAIGVDGTPRTIREVYDLLLIVRRALNPGESQASAASFVAKETIRVYRNLPHSVPGLVYMRDKNYLEHNERIWDTLMNSTPSLETYASIVAPWKNAVKEKKS